MKLSSYIYSTVILTMLLSTLTYVSVVSVFASNGEEHTDGPKNPLSATKTDNREAAKPGEILTYVITITNSSSENITVKIVDHLPAYLLPVATSPEAQANSDERTITWEQITVPGSGMATLGIQAQIVDNVPADHVINNEAKIYGVNTELTVSDATRIEAGNNTPAAAPIEPTAPTGTSEIFLVMGIVALIGGSVSLKKLSARLS